MIESIAIGSFDGVHIAHQKLIEIADVVVVIERFSASLTPGWKRSFYIDKPCYFYILEKIKGLTPKEFIAKLESDFPHLKRIIVGYDFRFGKAKSGTLESLKEYFSGEVVVVDEVKKDGISVHSRVIRQYLQECNMKVANRLLGRRYRIDGYETRGLGIGGKELVPTINLDVKDYVLPLGVFAVKVEIDKRSFDAVAFIGNRVSVDNSFSVEVHILDKFEAERNPYRKMWVEFVDFIRAIKKFDSFESLKAAIEADIKSAKKLLRRAT